MIVINAIEMAESYKQFNEFVELSNQFKLDSELLCTCFTAHKITSDQLSEMHQTIVSAFEKRSKEI